MAGGKSTPKKDRGLKASGGQLVKAGQIIVRHADSYKAGKNVSGCGTLFAKANGKISFTRKKVGKTAVKTYINVIPV
jgi:ribosomal protein L27